MNAEEFKALCLDPGLWLLPEKMDTPQARVMLRAIALQESRCVHRKQIRGPARGYWQFEKGGGVRGVLTHSATSDLAIDVCTTLNYSASSEVVYGVLADNDTLACVFARLLLWTLPAPLATTEDAAWNQYIDAWRPGKPHRSTWSKFWQEANK